MFHVSYFWQQSVSKTGGWSENFWNSMAALADVKTKADSMLDRLSNFKGNPVFCPRYRVSEVGKFRSGRTFLTGQTAGDPSGSPADYPTTKVQVKVSAGQAFTTQWLGGVYDSAINTGGFYRPNGTVAGYWRALAAELTTGTNGWSIYGLSPANLPALVLSLNTATGVVTTAAAAIVDSAVVRIKNVQSPRRANGVWRVQRLSDTSYQLYGWTAGTEVFKGINATIRQQGYAGSQITAVDIIQSTSHKVGKPTGLLGARRRKRAS